MNEFYKTEGIIIGKRDFSEADKLLVVMTPDLGKITIKAKGIKKSLAKMSGHLELFNYTQIDLVQGKMFFIATGAQVKETFSEMKKDFSRMSIFYYFGELVNYLVPDQVMHKDVFHYLLNSMINISKDSVNSFLVVLSFETQLLHLLGYKPELSHCVACGGGISPDSFSMSVLKGGVVCGKCCRDDWQICDLSNNALKVMRLMSAYDYQTIEKVNMDQSILSEIRHINDLLLEHQIGRKLKSRSFIQSPA